MASHQVLHFLVTMLCWEAWCSPNLLCKWIHSIQCCTPSWKNSQCHETSHPCWAGSQPTWFTSLFQPTSWLPSWCHRKNIWNSQKDYHCPSILLLEEPLSGVDTIGTLTILNILSLCQIRSGHYCLSNTPYARTVPFFDLALILTKEGHQAYFGPIGSNHDIILDYFLLIPKNPRYSKRESPVRYITGAVGLGITKWGTPSLKSAEIYKANTLLEINYNEISNIKNFTKNRKWKDSYATYPSPYSWQAILVLVRTQRIW